MWDFKRTHIQYKLKTEKTKKKNETKNQTPKTQALDKQGSIKLVSYSFYQAYEHA